MIRIIEGSLRAGAEGSVFAIVKFLTMYMIWPLFGKQQALSRDDRD